MRGGRGGQGSSSLGGVGGDGGDVTVCAVEGSQLCDLARLQSRRFIAGMGGEGKRSSACGRKGKAISITVPPGTVVSGTVMCGQHQAKRVRSVA